jgi:DNA-binding transcriptional ArsR family regulator
VDQATAAIADPVRRQILTALRDAPQTAGALAARFPISRPAVSRHLRVLRESGLVADTLRGRERVYVMTAEPLDEVATWIATLRPAGHWSRRLDALDTEVRRTARDSRRTADRTVPEQETA